MEALLEHTGDLDKAEVLQASIPEWLANADLNGVQALKSAFEQSFWLKPGPGRRSKSSSRWTSSARSN
ncbi:hypothetical protein [Pseudomonas izuensis]|uniref:Uncharacterized protein n=1 Tax=Pseudomonas izuensis TaxID=2684212 RepID=A0ABM7RVU3_9PSED|nr:hypothetical protein [Pseudomonas izuensis]BCX66848.1 hypothetical protein LAB08_R14720 [Pseudomonas izuensis]